MLYFFSLLACISCAPTYQAQYDGIFGKVCDQVAQRFKKFGDCLAADPAYQYLNGTFWYQAAHEQLCGARTRAAFNASVSNIAQANHGQIPKIAQLQTANNDAELELQAQFLFQLSLQAPLVTPARRDFTAWDAGSPFGTDQCTSLCELIKQGSETVNYCWSNYAMTVLYGVCEVGCYFYI